MREHFLEKLNQLYNDVHEMGKLSLVSVEDSITSITGMDKNLAEKVINGENKINEMQINIEKELTLIMATESPIVASDLREVIASLKIISNFERISDYAVHISRSVYKLKTIKEEFKILINEIKNVVLTMFHDLLKAYLDKDADMAVKIAAEDEKIDMIHDRFVEKLYHIDKKDIELEEFAKLLFIIRYLERVGDQIKNICECIIFGSTNEHRKL